MKEKIKEYAELLYSVFKKIVFPLWLIFTLATITIFLFIPALGLFVLFLLLGLLLNLLAGLYVGIYYCYIGYRMKSPEFKTIGLTILINQVLPSIIALFILSLIGVF